VAADPQTKLVDFGCESAENWQLRSRELLDIIRARNLAYDGHTMRKQGRCPEQEIMQGTMPGARRRGRPRTAWMDNIKTWTGLSVVRPTLGSRTAKKQNRTIDTQHQIRQRAYTISTQGGRVSSSSSGGNNLLHVQTERRDGGRPGRGGDDID